MSETTRTHVVLPKVLVDEVDERVGQRRRSQFMAEAVTEKLVRLRRTEALRRAGGSLESVSVPGWETPEAVTDWVSTLRRSSEDREREAWNRR